MFWGVCDDVEPGKRKRKRRRRNGGHQGQTNGRETDKYMSSVQRLSQWWYKARFYTADYIYLNVFYGLPTIYGVHPSILLINISA